MSERLTVILQDKDKINKSDLDKKADKLNINRTDLVKKGLDLINILDPRLIKYIDKLAGNNDLTFAEVVQAFVINRLAEIDAEKEVWEGPVLLYELMTTDQGAPDSEWLYDTLKKQHKKPMIKEKIQGLLEKEKAEEMLHNKRELLNDKEKEFLIKHKKGKTYYNSEQYKEDQEKDQKQKESYINYIKEIKADGHKLTRAQKAALKKYKKELND